MASGLCKNWSDARRIGTVDSTLVNEASGIAVSRQFPNRLYLHNDSGDGPFIYQTDGQGAGTRKVTIGGGYKPEDAEDITLGPCYRGKTCIFVGDIGDNKVKRETVEIAVVEEQARFADSVEPLARLRIKYPDGPHNAEGLAIHPNGDLFILTKEMTKAHVPLPAKLFRLQRAVWEESGTGALMPELLGEIDFPLLAADSSVWGQIVTGLDISDDGRKFLALTYDHVFEFNFDLSAGAPLATASMVLGRDYGVAKVKALQQQEAIAYTADQKSFLYTTEISDGTEQPLMQVDCLD